MKKNKLFIASESLVSIPTLIKELAGKVRFLDFGGSWLKVALTHFLGSDAVFFVMTDGMNQGGQGR